MDLGKKFVQDLKNWVQERLVNIEDGLDLKIEYVAPKTKRVYDIHLKVKSKRETK